MINLKVCGVFCLEQCQCAEVDLIEKSRRELHCKILNYVDFEQVYGRTFHAVVFCFGT